MRSTILRKAVYLPLMAMALTAIAPISRAAPLNSSGVANCEPWDFEAEASNLLKNVKDLSGKLKSDGNRLEALNTRNARTWQSHAEELAQAREHINKIGDRLDRLQAIQPVAAPWQQRAIAEIVPLAADLAAHTQAAMEHLNGNRTYLFSPEYKGHLTAIADRSGDLKSAVNTYLEYGATSQKHRQLEQKLDQLRDTIGLTES